MNLHQIIEYVHDCCFRMVPVLYPNVNIHYILDTEQSFCERNDLVWHTVQKSCCKNWNNHLFEYFHLLPTWLHYLVIRLLESSEARTWWHQLPVLDEFVDPAMLFEEECNPVHQMHNHTKGESIKDIGYNNSHRQDAIHIPEDALRYFNHLIFQILCWFPSLSLISLSPEFRLLDD